MNEIRAFFNYRTYFDPSISRAIFRHRGLNRRIGRPFEEDEEYDNIMARQSSDPIVFAAMEDPSDELSMMEPPCKKLCVFNNDIIKCLVDWGADINIKDYTGRTPLLLAMERNNTIAARTLLSLKANPNICDDRNITPIQVALKTLDLIQVFLSAGFCNELLVTAVLKGEAFLRKLQDCGVDLSLKLPGNMTIAHIAAAQGDSDMLEWLMTNVGSELASAIGSRRETPLHLAAESGHTECVRVLLKYDANPNERDKRGWTPLYWAVIEGYESVADILKEAGGTL